MEAYSVLLDFYAGKSPATSEFPSQRLVTWSFGVFLSALEPTVEQTMETPVTLDAIMAIMMSL